MGLETSHSSHAHIFQSFTELPFGADGGSDCAALGSCELALSALVLTEAIIRVERTRSIREVPHKNIFKMPSVVLIPELVMIWNG